jgi:hypothetical protein
MAHLLVTIEGRSQWLLDAREMVYRGVNAMRFVVARGTGTKFQCGRFFACP